MSSLHVYPSWTGAQAAAYSAHPFTASNATSQPSVGLVWLCFLLNWNFYAQADAMEWWYYAWFYIIIDVVNIECCLNSWVNLSRVFYSFSRVVEMKLMHSSNFKGLALAIKTNICFINQAYDASRCAQHSCKKYWRSLWLLNLIFSRL